MKKIFTILLYGFIILTLTGYKQDSDYPREKVKFNMVLFK